MLKFNGRVATAQQIDLLVIPSVEETAALPVYAEGKWLAGSRTQCRPGAQVFKASPTCAAVFLGRFFPADPGVSSLHLFRVGSPVTWPSVFLLGLPLLSGGAHPPLVP